MLIPHFCLVWINQISLLCKSKELLKSKLWYLRSYFYKFGDRKYGRCGQRSSASLKKEVVLVRNPEELQIVETVSSRMIILIISAFLFLTVTYCKHVSLESVVCSETDENKQKWCNGKTNVEKYFINNINSNIEFSSHVNIAKPYWTPDGRKTKMGIKVKPWPPQVSCLVLRHDPHSECNRKIK